MQRLGFSYVSRNACQFYDGGATFRDRPLRDPFGEYYPIDKAHYLTLNADLPTESIALVHSLEHSGGSGCAATARFVAVVAEGTD